MRLEKNIVVAGGLAGIGWAARPAMTLRDWVSRHREELLAAASN